MALFYFSSMATKNSRTAWYPTLYVRLLRFESQIDERRNFIWTYKKLGCFLYCELILCGTSTFFMISQQVVPCVKLNTTRAPRHLVCVINVFGLKIPYMMGHVEIESHIDGRMNFTWAYKKKRPSTQHTNRRFTRNLSQLYVKH